MMKFKKEKIKLDGNQMMANTRVNLDNKTMPHKNKKKYKDKYKCRKKIKL